MRIWGTSWLADALVEAARLYAGLSSSDSSQRPITVSAAALREGGNVPNEMGYQTGLEARIKLPSNVSIANMQAVALARAGFSLFLADCDDGPQCVLLPRSPLPPNVPALRVVSLPRRRSFRMAAEERVDCNGPAAVAVSHPEMGGILRAADELQLRARTLQSVLAALESAWRVRDVGHAAAVLATRPQVTPTHVCRVGVGRLSSSPRRCLSSRLSLARSMTLWTTVVRALGRKELSESVEPT